MCEINPGRATSTEQEQKPSVVQTDEKEKEEEPDTGMMIERPDVWGLFGTMLCVSKAVWGFHGFPFIGWRSQTCFESTSIRGRG